MSDNERTSLLAEAFLHHIYAFYDDYCICISTTNCDSCPYLRLCGTFSTNAHTFDSWKTNLREFMQRTDFIANHPHLFI